MNWSSTPQIVPVHLERFAEQLRELSHEVRTSVAGLAGESVGRAVRDVLLRFWQKSTPKRFPERRERYEWERDEWDERERNDRWEEPEERAEPPASKVPLSKVALILQVGGWLLETNPWLLLVAGVGIGGAALFKDRLSFVSLDTVNEITDVASLIAILTSGPRAPGITLNFSINNSKRKETNMNTTASANLNGRKESRRSLSQELDRLDKMLDGLAEAIPAAVADSVKEAVTTAVAEAFRATLMEVVCKPEIIALLRGDRTATVSTEQSAPAKAPLHQQIRKSASNAWKLALTGLKLMANFVVSPVQTVVRCAITSYRQINMIWGLRKPILVALGVGVVIGVAAYASAPWLCATIAGCGAASTTLLGQFAVWTRRMYASFSFG